MLQYIYVELNLFAVIIAIWMLVLLRHTRMNGTARKFFCAVLCIILGIFASDSVAIFVDGKTFPGARELNIAANFVYFLLQGAACCLFGLFCAKYQGITFTRVKKICYWIPLAISVILSLVNLGGEIFYRIDEGNTYVRKIGFWYLLYSLCVMGYLLYCLSLFLRGWFKAGRTRDRERREDCLYMAVVLVIPFIGSAIQIAFYGLSTMWISGILTLLMIYSWIQGQSAYRVERELTDRRVATMISQIQPHFIFNTLTTIRRLCCEDCEKAEEAILQFSQYLRLNIDSLSNPAPIAFGKELEHIRTYLELEKMRFGDRLHFECDIAAESFLVPVLSIQPLVENAVRYGISKRKEGGTIKLTTGETEKAFFVTVEDDGVGFDANEAVADGRVHTGISNARVRIEALCGGSLTLQSEIGRGSVARITLPKKNQGQTGAELR